MNEAEKLVAQYKAKPKPEPTLAQYIAAYIEEEKDRGNRVIDVFMIQDAIDAYMGGAR